MATPEALPVPITPAAKRGAAPAPTPGTRKRERQEDVTTSPVASSPGSKKLRINQNENE